MCLLLEEEKKTLLAIARNAISAIFVDDRRLEIPAASGGLSSLNGAFVTLHKRGRLRGCMGRLVSHEPLSAVVALCAVAAATEDPRFSPLCADELSELEIEISVLSELQVADPGQIEPGVHGLVISLRGQRGVLLPQVAAEHGWSRERFLQETCRKAGLPPDGWKDSGVQLEIFTAEVFSEAAPRVSSGGSANAAIKKSGYSSSQ